MCSAGGRARRHASRSAPPTAPDSLTGRPGGTVAYLCGSPAAKPRRSRLLASGSCSTFRDVSAEFSGAPRTRTRHETGALPTRNMRAGYRTLRYAAGLRDWVLFPVKERGGAAVTYLFPSWSCSTPSLHLGPPSPSPSPSPFAIRHSPSTDSSTHSLPIPHTARNRSLSVLLLLALFLHAPCSPG